MSVVLSAFSYKRRMLSTCKTYLNRSKCFLSRFIKKTHHTLYIVLKMVYCRHLLSISLRISLPSFYPVCANMIQTLVHTCRGLGCSIFIETIVKRQSNQSPLKVFNIQHYSAHFQPSIIILKYHFKSVCLLGTTARVLRVLNSLKTSCSR